MCHHKKRIHTVLVVLVFILLIPGQPSAGEIRVGTWKTAQTIQPFFYDRFLTPPDTVRVFSFTNPADQKTALIAGSLEMCGTTVAHAIHSASLGQPVVLVAALCNKCSALVVKKNGPVKKVADLKGKKIGYVPGTMHEILLRETLVQNGIDPNRDVRLTRVDFFDMGMALASGGIDAFLSGEPFPTLAQEQGFGEILVYPYFGGTIGSINAGMLVKQKTIQKRPDLVYRLVMAHAKATEYLNTHKTGWLTRASQFGVTLNILKKAEPNMELAWQMDASFVQRVRALGERMQALGIIKRPPEYDRLIDLSFVSRVKEEIQ